MIVYTLFFKIQTIVETIVTGIFSNVFEGVILPFLTDRPIIM